MKDFIHSAVLAVLVVAPLAASARPPLTAVSKDDLGTPVFSFDANYILSIKDAAKRRAVIEEYAYEAGASAPDSKEGMANATAAVASFLEDLLEPAGWKSHAQAVFTPFTADSRPMIIEVNLYKNSTGEIFQYVGRFQPTLSGITDGVHEKGIGLTVHARVVRQLDSPNESWIFLKQYVGADHLEALASSVDIKEYLAKRDVVVTTRVESWRKSRGRLKDAVAVKTADVVVVYSETRALGTLANLFVKAVSPVFPAPFQELACPGADLSADFPMPWGRDQGQVGSCHVFASTALLENGLFRAFKLKLALSEQDLFDLYKGIQEGSLKIVSPAYDAATRLKGGGFLTDGGAPLVDVLLAKYFGMATRRTVPYTIGKKVFRIEGEAAPSPPAKSTVDAERKVTAEAFKALSVNLEQFTPLDAGISQKYALIKQLCAGRPAAVGLNIRGLDGWFDDDKSKGKVRDTLNMAPHAFAIVGFERKTVNGESAFVFKTRNSWHNGRPNPNPDIPESELWRLYNFVTIDAKPSKAPAGLAALVP